MKKLLLIAAVAAAIPYPANADMPAKELKDFCQDYPQKGEATTMCIGYIWGSFDAARALKAACEPAGISSRRLINLANQTSQGAAGAVETFRDLGDPRCIQE